MIEVSSLISKIRFKTKDFDEVKFSDYELFQAINDTLDYMSNSYALQNSDFLEKIKIYNHNDDETYSLPTDFAVLISVVNVANGEVLKPCSVGQEPEPWEYKVVDGKIYTKIPCFRIAYRKRLEEIDSKADDIDLPPMFERVIRDSAAAILVGEGAGVESVLEESLQAIIPRRRYAHAKIPMPFKV